MQMLIHLGIDKHQRNTDRANTVDYHDMACEAATIASERRVILISLYHDVPTAGFYQHSGIKNMSHDRIIYKFLVSMINYLNWSALISITAT